MTSALRLALVLVAAVVAGMAANVILLGVASGGEEPVGRLSPRVEFAAPAQAWATPSVRSATALPRPGHEAESADD